MNRLAILFYEFSFESKSLDNRFQTGKSRDVVKVPEFGSADDVELWLHSQELRLAQLVSRKDPSDREGISAKITNIVYL